MDLCGGSLGLLCASGGAVVGRSRDDTAAVLGTGPVAPLRRLPAGRLGFLGEPLGFPGHAAIPARSLTPAFGYSERLSASRSCEPVRRAPQGHSGGPSCGSNSLSNEGRSSKVRPPRAQAPPEPSLYSSKHSAAPAAWRGKAIANGHLQKQQGELLKNPTHQQALRGNGASWRNARNARSSVTDAINDEAVLSSSPSATGTRRGHPPPAQLTGRQKRRDNVLSSPSSETEGSDGNDLSDRLNSRRPYRRDSVLPELVSALTGSPSPASVPTVLASFPRQILSTRLLASAMKQLRKDWRLVLAVYRWMKAEGFSLTVHIYTMVIMSLGNGYQWYTMEEILSDMESAGVEKDEFVYNTLMVSNFKAGRQEEAWGWYLELQSSGLAVQANPVLWTTVLKVCTRTGRHEEAQRVSDRMRAQPGFRPDAMTVATLITAYSQAGNLTSALEVFEEMRQRPRGEWDVVVWNAAVSAYARAGEPQQAEGLVKEMEDVWWEGLQGDADGGGERKGGPGLGSAGTTADNFDSSTVRSDITTAATSEAISSSSKSGMIASSGHRTGESEDQVSDLVLVREVPNCEDLMSGAATGEGPWRTTKSRRIGRKQERDVNSAKSSVSTGADRTDAPSAPAAAAEVASTPTKANGVSTGTTIGTTDARVKRVTSGHGGRRVPFGPTSHAYNALIHAYAQAGNSAAAEETKQRMLLRGFLPNPVTYNTLLSLYASWPASRSAEAVEKAEALVEEMQSNGMTTPDVYSYCTLIGLYSRAGVPERASLAYQRMQARGVEPDLHVYSAMIALYARQQKFDEVVELYASLKERKLKPDATILTSLLGVYHRQGLIEEAAAVAAEIEKLGQGIDPVVSSAVISFFSKAGRLGDAVRVFEAARRNFGMPSERRLHAGFHPKRGADGEPQQQAGAPGAPQESFSSGGQQGATSTIGAAHIGGPTVGSTPSGTPSVATNLAPIGGMSPRSPWQLSVKKWNRRRREPVDAVLLSAMIDAYAKAGEVEAAEKLFQELQSLETPGYKNVVAYTTMITLLGKQRRVQQARELFLQLANAGLPMDVVVYNALLDALAKGGEWETAHRVFKGMLRSGPVPTVYTYSILVDMFGKEGNLLEASKLFAHMLQSGLRPSAVTFNSLIHMFAKAGLCNDAEELLRRMQREGVQPNTVTFNILIKMHAEAGNPWDAIRTFRAMERAGCDPDAPLLNLVASMYGKLGKYFRRHEGQGAPRMQTLGRMVAGPARLGRGEEEEEDEEEEEEEEEGEEGEEEVGEDES